MICKGTLIAVPETTFWDAATLEKYGIAEAFGLYLVADDSSTTVDVRAEMIQNVFMHWIETPDDLRDEARDMLDQEGRAPHEYLMRSQLDCDDRLKLRIAVEIDDEDEMGPDAALHALMESIHSGSEDEPAVLDYATWAQWRAERIEKRRARNLPPIANWGMNGLDNLPLYVHAANAMHAAHKDAYKRLDEIKGGCAASHVFKTRLAAAGMHWPL